MYSDYQFFALNNKEHQELKKSLVLAQAEAEKTRKAAEEAEEARKVAEEIIKQLSIKKDSQLEKVSVLYCDCQLFVYNKSQKTTNSYIKSYFNIIVCFQNNIY